ncbi:GFA family protein [Fretibacter rubidus]|uniref:GFA family protein n=1 Tax=Fretibacter rubidus TaxID=570162 RepID=UPI00352AD4A6
MPKITGQCLCGDVKFSADGEIDFQGNCHCTDCRQVTGAAFATLVFMNKADIKITGETKSYDHTVDSGNTLTKHFCPNCGSAMFGGSAGRPDNIAIRGGQINEQDVVVPQFNVYAGSKMDCVTLDASIPAFDKMPPTA